MSTAILQGVIHAAGPWHKAGFDVVSSDPPEPPAGAIKLRVRTAQSVAVMMQDGRGFACWNFGGAWQPWRKLDLRRKSYDFNRYVRSMH